MKTLITTVSLLILTLGSSVSPAESQVLDPRRTLLASNYGSDSYAALTSAAGFPSAGEGHGIPQVVPGFSHQPESAPEYAPSNPEKADSPTELPGTGEDQCDSDRTGPG